MSDRPARQVVVLGAGAIGAPVAEALRAGEVAGARLIATIDEEGIRGEYRESWSWDDLVRHADLVVEAAGQDALATHGPPIIGAGVDLLALSIGALAQPRVHERLTAGPGRLYLSTGAVGGLDLVRALADRRLLTQVTIHTTKKPTTLVQSWMDDRLRRSLTEALAPVEVLRGEPEAIARAFPRSANVAMSTALAAGDPSLVEAVVIADPGCATTTHEIRVDATIGSHRFVIGNQPSPENPATSAVVPLAVLRALRDLVGRPVTLI